MDKTPATSEHDEAVRVVQAVTQSIIGAVDEATHWALQYHENGSAVEEIRLTAEIETLQELRNRLPAMYGEHLTLSPLRIISMAMYEKIAPLKKLVTERTFLEHMPRFHARLRGTFAALSEFDGWLTKALVQAENRLDAAGIPW